MSALTSDLRQSVRIIRSKPGFSLMAVLMLALGIGACTAIFTVVNAVLLQPLPYTDAAGLVQLFEVSSRGGQINVPEGNFVDWKAGTRTVENMAMFAGGISPLTVGKETVRARLAVVSDGFFDIFKVQPAMGVLSKEGVVVSTGFWQRVLGGGSFRINGSVWAAKLFLLWASCLPVSISPEERKCGRLVKSADASIRAAARTTGA